MILIKHAPCGAPLAKYVGKMFIKGMPIFARDYELMDGTKPTPFEPILCPNCGHVKTGSCEVVEIATWEDMP